MLSSVKQNLALELIYDIFVLLVNTRVLKDAFHLMDIIPYSQSHGLCKEFSRRLRVAIFVIDWE